MDRLLIEVRISLSPPTLDSSQVEAQRRCWSHASAKGQLLCSIQNHLVAVYHMAKTERSALSW